MALASGTKLGPYEIQSSVGAGGMGEVYKARDTRLGRTVAVKVLPAAFSTDADRLQRFEHEARILSTLNHPNLLAIYDVGEHNGVRYLVSEFLEGQSLREILAAGPLSRRRVSAYALEIAKGLAAAHEKGIVHRDLKPDNVFVTRDDVVKILDFGLARQTPPASGTEESPTVTMHVPTTPGTVMGTVGYMSPEQVRGETVDHRSDIFSFGAVLYEMVSGKRAFSGDSSVETMNAILKEDVQELPGSIGQSSPGMERIIRRCLEKKPERRFQSASDLAFALDALSSASGVTQGLPAAVPGARRLSPARSFTLWLGVGLLAAAVLLALGLWLFARPRRSSLVDYTELSFHPAYIRTARFAPGGTVVYAPSFNGELPSLFSARTDTLESQPLNLQADLLAISHSGELALSLGRTFKIWEPSGRLAKAPLGGGSVREMLDNVVDADWNKDGTDLAIARVVGNSCRLEYPAGKVLYETSGYISDLRFSPTGDQIAFLDHSLIGDDRGTVSVIDLQDNAPQAHRRVLTEDYSTTQGLAWSPSGNEIWYTAGLFGGHGMALHAVDLRGRSRLVASAPIRMHLEDIAPDGRVLLSTESLRWEVGIGDSKSGHWQELTSFAHPYLAAITNDGSTILMNGFDVGTTSNYRLYLQRADGSAPLQIGEGAGSAFSADGKWAAAIDPVHPEKVNIIPTGVGDARTIQAPPGRHYEGVGFLPDNEHVLVTTNATGQSRESTVQGIADGSVRVIGNAGRSVPYYFDSLNPGPSPDGRFCIETDGKGKFWLQPLDGSAAHEITGVGPDEMILNWHNDSNNVFVVHSTGTDVDINTLNLATGERKPWTHFSPADKAATFGTITVVITVDGSRFAVMIHRLYSNLFLASGLH
jgi:eukaryotic-like serine/threonine-protein kinase